MEIYVFFTISYVCSLVSLSFYRLKIQGCGDSPDPMKSFREVNTSGQTIWFDTSFRFNKMIKPLGSKTKLTIWPPAELLLASTLDDCNGHFGYIYLCFRFQMD